MEGSICKAQIEFIHSLPAICIVQLKLLTKDQMALFLRRDSKGPGAVSTYPCVRKVKGGKFEATYRENWKRRRYTHAMQYASTNLSPHATHTLSPPSTLLWMIMNVVNSC
jgi:hypothetical protein